MVVSRSSSETALPIGMRPAAGAINEAEAAAAAMSRRERRTAWRIAEVQAGLDFSTISFRAKPGPSGREPRLAQFPGLADWRSRPDPASAVTVTLAE